ncbi:MAG: GAF domain-containing protein [Anaerolineae bacterium]|nr:GAF domain-containing protein [Anaerolineae bacterium]
MSEPTELRLHWYQRLRTFLVFWFVALTVIPMVLVAILIITQLRSQTEDQVIDQLESVVEAKTQAISLWLSDSYVVLQAIERSDARDRRLVALSSPTTFGVDQQRDIVNRVFTELVDVAETDVQTRGFVEIFFFGLDGQVQASSNENQIGKSMVNQPYFTRSLQEAHFQPPYYERGSGELTSIMTLPVRDTNGRIVGVLAGRLNLDRLDDIMQERAGLGESGETYLVSRETGYFLTPSLFADAGYVQNQPYTSEGIEKALAGTDGSGIYDDYRDPPVSVIGVYRWMPTFEVAMLAEIDESQAFEAFNSARNLAIGLAVLAAFGAAGIGLVVALSVSRPIGALTRVAGRLEAGDMTERAAIRRRNEVGLLANAFNNMAAQLEELVGSLETRVAERTRDLQIAAQVSERVATILNPDQLLPQVVELTKESFGLYHAHIYLYDARRENLVLAAGAGEAGQVMRSRGHRIPVSARSLSAQAAREGQAVIVDDVKADPNFLANPLLPDTRSEAALPLTVGDRVIGVLDVQSEHIARFDDDLISVLSTFAGQIAVSLDNARLFREMEQARRQDQVLGALTHEIQRATSIDDVLRSAARELGKALRVSETAIELHLPVDDRTDDLPEEG